MTQAPTQEQIRGAWDSLAPAFDENMTPRNINFAQDILAGTGVRPGTRLLDVAAGSGAISIPAARMGAEVVATDISPAMIERLLARARAEGLSTITAQVMAGQSLAFADDTFDISASQHGVSLFPDVGAGLAEMARVTKRGGKVLVIGFGAVQKAEFLGFFIRAAQAAVPGFTPLPMDPPPLPFQLANPDVMRQRLDGAGLADVTVRTTTWDLEFESPTAHLNMLASGHPIGAQLTGSLTEQQRTEVLQVLDGMFRERSGGRPGAVLHTEITIGTGTK